MTAREVALDIEQYIDRVTAPLPPDDRLDALAEVWAAIMDEFEDLDDADVKLDADAPREGADVVEHRKYRKKEDQWESRRNARLKGMSGEGEDG